MNSIKQVASAEVIEEVDEDHESSFHDKTSILSNEPNFKVSNVKKRKISSIESPTLKQGKSPDSPEIPLKKFDYNTPMIRIVTAVEEKVERDTSKNSGSNQSPKTSNNSISSNKCSTFNQQKDLENQNSFITDI